MSLHTDPSTVVVCDFIRRFHKQVFLTKSREKYEFYDMIDQIDLTEIHRTFFLDTAEYTFFSASLGTFFKIDYTLID